MQELYDMIMQTTGMNVNTLQDLGALTSGDIGWGAQDVYNIGSAAMSPGLFQPFSKELLSSLNPGFYNPMMEGGTRRNMAQSLMPAMKARHKGTGFAGSSAPSPYMDAREQFRGMQMENVSNVASAQADARQLAISGIQDWQTTAQQLLGT
tara:strand:+ start:5922 stop:6374 length:453 start_codon:yes stop_codon:yes gene_type:complete